jgi:CheY-like chemotaxis protein
VLADPHQLEQVIMNLVVNARDAMPGGGRLLIETAPVPQTTAERDESYARLYEEAPAGRYVMLEVSDSGVGIDEETRQRIFEPFFTTKGTGMGTGLGLSTVQGIVAQSGGHISVDSEPGNGTTFRIYLPALYGAADCTEETAPARVVGGRETVLVVEDQAAVREFVAAALKSYGYRVIQADSAGEALSFCEREERIDLVLTDVVMPNLSGQNLAASLRRHRPEIKVLFMSGYTETRVLDHGALGGDAHFIEKPFSPEELAGKVRAVLGAPAPGARILVVDDQEGVRGFLRIVLEEGGYEVFEAENGKQALRRALSERVDLITTDLGLLEEEGIETIRALREEEPGVGLIAISGAYEGKLLEVARLLEADAMLSKPLSAALLLSTVAEVLKPQVTTGRIAHD